MLNFIKKVQNDKRGYLYHYFRIFLLEILRFLSQSYVLVAICKGIKLGKQSRFFGKPYFVRYPNSVVTIGSGCTFRSISFSNLIGINHRCIIATISKFGKISIGNNCGFSGTTIGAGELISIGNDVLVGANSLITDSDWHAIDPVYRNTYPAKTAPVYIENNVWIGYNVTILKGVRIGENSIIAANSLVVKDIPPNVIAGGNPCKIISKLS